MNDARDPLAGLRPIRPPSELRARVLAAAREAAARPAPGLLASLYHDRLLRVCAAGFAALVIANVVAAGRGSARGSVAPPTAYSVDDAAIPDGSGLTAAEQLDELAPVLGDAVSRSRG